MPELGGDATRFLKELVQETRQISMMLRVLIREPLLRAMGEVLSEPELAVIYQLSDGRSSRQVADDPRVTRSHVTITGYWKKWASMGLMRESEAYSGRYERVFDLEILGFVYDEEG